MFQYFDSKLKIFVKTDVFDEKLDKIMLQMNSDEQLYSIAFFSKIMLLVECNYEIYDKKFLAVI